MSSIEQGAFSFARGAGGPRTVAPDSFARSDAFEYLARLPDACVDLVITDPPYESLELHRGKGTTTRLVGAWFTTVPNEQLPRLLSEVFRVLRPNRHFYLFCDEITADVIKEQQGISSRRDDDGARTCKSGFRYWRELVWAKTTRDGARIHGGMGYHYRSACERVMFFEKGKRKLNDLSVPDVLMAARPEYKAPAGKPLKVVETLLVQSTTPGEIVLDPFAGSGVVGLAAIRTERHFLLNDLDHSYVLDDVRRVAVANAEGEGAEGGGVEGAPFELPWVADPERFIEQLVGDAPPEPAVQHDIALFGLSGESGAALVERLTATRPIERSALLKRHIRSSAWMERARHVARSGGAQPVLREWLAWLGR